MVFYRANKAGTGCLLDLSVDARTSTKNKGVYLTFQRQTGDLNGSSPFKGGERLTAKISQKEIGGLLHTLEAKEKFSAVHTTDEATTQFFFNFSDRGFVLSVKRGDTKFAVGFAPDDSVVLREWLKFALERIFNGLYAESK